MAGSLATKAARLKSDHFLSEFDTAAAMTKATVDTGPPCDTTHPELALE